MTAAGPAAIRVPFLPRPKDFIRFHLSGEEKKVWERSRA